MGEFGKKYENTIVNSIINGSKKVMKDVHIKESVIKTDDTLGLMLSFVTKSGDVMARTVTPFMFTFERKDIAQVFIGSLLLSTPFMMTEEVWQLGTEISYMSAAALVSISLMSLIVLNYYTRYRLSRTPEGKIPGAEFVKRIFGTYAITLLIVATLMTILGKAPWSTDLAVALKRTILVSLPACLGGSAADMVK